MKEAEQAGLFAQCDALARRFAERADAHDKAGSFAHENVADLNAARLSGLTIPSHLGGRGANLYEMVEALERIGSGDASTALGCAMQWFALGNLAQQQVWRQGAFQRMCDECMTHNYWINNVASEPELGSPSRGGAFQTVATPVPAGYKISGHKSWVTWAPALGYLIVWARLGEATGVFCVRADSPGIQLQNNWADAVSLRASGSCDVLLQDVFVPEAWLVEVREPGITKTGNLPSAWSTLGFAASYLGIGAAALRTLADYARNRIPTALGKPIAELPHVRRALGQMDLTLRAARSVLHAAAHRWDAHPAARASMAAEVAAAKYLCSNAAVTVTDLAMRTAGARALDRGLPLERLMRDARAGLMHPPQDEVALDLLGQGVLAQS